MIYRSAIVITALLCGPASSAGQDKPQAPATDRPLKVLLIGNSLTYTNHLASPVTAFSMAAQPRPWQVSEQAMPNARLSQMFALRTTEYLLKDEPWDYLVLQENGNIYPTGLFSAAKDFDTAAKKIGARIILFENWRGRASSQNEVTEIFVKLAKELNAKVAPVGQAWQIVRELDSSIQLRDGDGVHPSPIGTYVAGCVIYATIAEVDTCPTVTYGSVDEHVSQIAREATQRAMANSRKALLPP